MYSEVREAISLIVLLGVREAEEREGQMQREREKEEGREEGVRVGK